MALMAARVAAAADAEDDEVAVDAEWSLPATEERRNTRPAAAVVAVVEISPNRKCLRDALLYMTATV